jgi:hypothetical protein
MPTHLPESLRSALGAPASTACHAWSGEVPTGSHPVGRGRSSVRTEARFSSHGRSALDMHDGGDHYLPTAGGAHIRARAATRYAGRAHSREVDRRRRRRERPSDHAVRDHDVASQKMRMSSTPRDDRTPTDGGVQGQDRRISHDRLNMPSGPEAQGPGRR